MYVNGSRTFSANQLNTNYDIIIMTVLSPDSQGKQVDVEMEANLCYGPVAGPQVPAIEDRRPMAGEDTSQYETISH